MINNMTEEKLNEITENFIRLISESNHEIKFNFDEIKSYLIEKFYPDYKNEINDCVTNNIYGCFR